MMMTVMNKNYFIMGTVGQEIICVELKITFEATIVVAKINPPKQAPYESNAPPSFFPAEEFESMSGEPFAKAIKVTAAIVGERLNLSERSCIPTARYLSAIPATFMKRRGNKKQIKMNIKIAFLSVCL